MSWSGPARCVACGAPFHRWIAYPPTGSPARSKPKPARRPPYAGPPSYRGGHPQWAFPPVVWHDLPATDPFPVVRDPAPALRSAAWLSLATAVLAVVAAGAEMWRFSLMLDSRTKVLSGRMVQNSDILVAATGSAVVLAGLATLLVGAAALVRAHRAAAVRLGRAPSRRPVAIAARLLVPIWNIYGAGQIVAEVDRMLAGAKGTDSDKAARVSRLTMLWWLGWIVSSLLMIATLVRGIGGSLQAIADTVELHIALDLVAVVVAAIGFALLRRFATAFTGRRSEYDGWVVQPPAPTRQLTAATAAVTADR